MNSITTRQFNLLRDSEDIYNFLLEIYSQDWRNGVAAPFFEYAMCSTWMDLSYTHRYRIWQHNGQIVAFCFSEDPVTDCFFCLRPNYEFLADEMVNYAKENMPDLEGKQRFVLFKGQDALFASAKKAGYTTIYSFVDYDFNFDKELNYPLPDGYSFVPTEEMDLHSIARCCYYGFNHEQEEGPWDGNDENCRRLAVSAHATHNYAVAIRNNEGEYVCYAGMWWTPQNKLAYMEPLCTVPQHRRKGLAAAALSEMYRRMKKLGATHMTGGSNAFYPTIGFTPVAQRFYFAKDATKHS